MISKMKSKRIPIPAKTQKELSAGKLVAELTRKATQSVSEVIKIDTPASLSVLPILLHFVI